MVLSMVRSTLKGAKLPQEFWGEVTRRNRDFTRSCIKTKSKLTNLMKIIQIEGYNGK